MGLGIVPAPGAILAHQLSAARDAACLSEDVSVDSDCCFSGTGNGCCSCTSSADICCVLPLCSGSGTGRQDKSAWFYTCAFLLSVVLCDLPCAGGPVYGRPYAVSMFAGSWWLNTRWLSCQLLSVVPSLWRLHFTSLCIFANAETFMQVWKCESYFSQGFNLSCRGQCNSPYADSCCFSM